VALVQFGRSCKGFLEGNQIVSLDCQGDSLEQVHGFAVTVS